MKIFLLLSFFVPGMLFCQDTINHFKLENGHVTWERSFPTSLSAYQVFSNIKATNIFDIATIDSPGLTGKLKPYDLDFKGAGYSEWTAPIYLSRNSFDGFCTVEFQGDKYLVTVSQMQLIMKYDDPMTQKGETLPFEKIALNQSNGYSAGFVKSPSAILDYNLSKMFGMSPNLK